MSSKKKNQMLHWIKLYTKHKTELCIWCNGFVVHPIDCKVNYLYVLILIHLNVSGGCKL